MFDYEELQRKREEVEEAYRGAVDDAKSAYSFARERPFTAAGATAGTTVSIVAAAQLAVEADLNYAAMTFYGPAASGASVIGGGGIGALLGDRIDEGLGFVDETLEGED